jgi:hypothetical protein
LPVIIFTAAMLAALPLDVLTLVLKWRVPSNDIRFLTGLLFGASVCVLLYPSVVVLLRGKMQTLSALPSLQKVLWHYLIVGSAALMAKWDNLFSYALLSVLSIFGCLSLAAMLMTGLWKTIEKTFKSKHAIE